MDIKYEAAVESFGNKLGAFSTCLLRFLEEENGENVEETTSATLVAGTKAENSRWKGTVNRGWDKNIYALYLVLKRQNINRKRNEKYHRERIDYLECQLM